MNTTKVSLIILFLCSMVISTNASAASFSGSGPRDSLDCSTCLDRISIGAMYERYERHFSSNYADYRPDMDAFSVQVGYDALRWLTILASAGSMESADASFDDRHFRWSLETAANLAHFDVTEPDFMRGRLSLQSNLGFSRVERGGRSNGKTEWNEFFGSLTLNYEVYKDKAENLDIHPYSIVFFAGPAFSVVDGRARDNSRYFNFDEARTFGAVAGLDIYPSHNFSIGAQILNFDHNIFSTGVRYHF